MAVNLSILTSNSTRTVLDALAPGYTRATGNTIALSADSAKKMLARIKAGETGDIVVLGTATVDELAALGTVAAASRRPFARAVVGVGVKAGAPRPDIRSVDALRCSLLAAKSIAHTVHGASGMYIPILLEKLGIAQEMKAKTVTREGGYIGVVVTAGEAEIALQQIPELLAVPGLEIVGPLPDSVQKVFETSAGIFASSAARPAAEAFLESGAASGNAGVFREKGLEPA